MSSLVGKYVQDAVLEITDRDVAYIALNKEILRVEKEFKKELSSIGQRKKYNELEELVIKSITHVLFATCENLILRPHPINTPLTLIKEPL